MFSHINQTRFGKALPVQVSHRFSVDSAVFDDDNLVSCAGLVPVMALAERTGMSDLLAQMVHIAVPRIKSGSANPAPKLATLIAMVSLIRRQLIRRRTRQRQAATVDLLGTTLPQ